MNQSQSFQLMSTDFQDVGGLVEPVIFHKLDILCFDRKYNDYTVYIHHVDTHWITLTNIKLNDDDQK